MNISGYSIKNDCICGVSPVMYKSKPGQSVIYFFVYTSCGAPVEIVCGYYHSNDEKYNDGIMRAISVQKKVADFINKVKST